MLFLSGAWYPRYVCEACRAEAYKEPDGSMRCAPGTPTADYGTGPEREPWPRTVGDCEYEAALRTMAS